MRWVVVGGSERHDDRARSLAADLGLPFGHVESLGPGEEGAVFVGTDHDLARYALSGPRRPIALVPASQSDLARMFGLASSVPTTEEISQRLCRGGPYRCDLGVAGDGMMRHPFVAHVIASRRGSLPSWWSRRATVEMVRDGAPMDFDAAAIVVANAQHLNGRTVAPRAAVMDGRAEVQVIGGGARERAKALRAMERGLHLGASAIHRRPFRTLQLRTPARWVLATDGVVVGSGVWDLTIVPGAFSLWV